MSLDISTGFKCTGAPGFVAKLLPSEFVLSFLMDLFEVVDVASVFPLDDLSLLLGDSRLLAEDLPDPLELE